MTDDRLAIADLVHAYCDAVCRNDAAAWGDTWADDAEWDLGRGVVTGKGAIVGLWLEAMGRYSVVIQNAFNSTAVVEGDRASGRCYVIEHVQGADGTPHQMLAWYDDAYARTPAGWRFASRRLTVLYRGPADLSGDFTRPSSRAS